jgi:hypothetical protein
MAWIRKFRVHHQKAQSSPLPELKSFQIPLEKTINDGERSSENGLIP